MGKYVYVIEIQLRETGWNISTVMLKHIGKTSFLYMNLYKKIAKQMQKFIIKNTINVYKFPWSYRY